jgi:shikimate kinase
MVSATARCGGAASIVNAIATGKGAAFGLDLEAKATVELQGGDVTALGVQEPKLVETCVKNALSLFPYKYGATIRIESNIPIARGLKSSSAVANASVLATLGALAKLHGSIKTVRIDKEQSRQMLKIGNEEIKDETILDISVQSARECGVTITGALDDAAACYFGGFVVTDNSKNSIIRRGEMEKLGAVILVPEEKSFTKDFDVAAVKKWAREVDAIWNLALQGDLYTAMTLNGLAYSAALGMCNEAAKKAMDAGALAAGLSGTGPAIVAITKGNTDDILNAWQGLGKTLEAKINNEKAKVIL